MKQVASRNYKGTRRYIFTTTAVRTSNANFMELSLLEKPPILQPLQNFPAFYGTRRFITVFTRALHWSLS
jgi:hypothetical protein